MMNDDETRNASPRKGRNYKMAQKFLAALDWEGSYTFQTFDDDKARRKARGKKPDPLARILHGTLDDHWDALVKLNDKGAGIYVTVNRTDGVGRKENNILKVNAVFIDNDRAGVSSEFLYELACPPTMVVTTSPGKWHAYWVVEGMPLDIFTPFQQFLAKEFDTDPDVKDVCRVMRVPGFMHRKGEPAMVTLDHIDGAYQYSDLRVGLHFKVPRLRIVKEKPVRTERFEASIDQVRGLLDHIIKEDPEYLNGPYHVWLELGMALHEWDEVEGLDLWKYVSQNSVHYDEGECEDKWETFNSDREGIKTLATYCKDFEYKISTHERSSAEEDFAGIEKSERQGTRRKRKTVLDDPTNWSDFLISRGRMTKEIAQAGLNQKFCVKGFIPEGTITVIVGRGGTGKTAIIFSTCKEMIENGYKVFYVHADAVAHGYEIGRKLQEDLGDNMNYLVTDLPNYDEPLRAQDVVKMLDELVAAKEPMDKVVFVFDVLVNFVNNLNKKEDVIPFMELLRRASRLGATFVLLGHTNKDGKKEDGKNGLPAFQGVSDVMNLVDNLLYLRRTDNSQDGIEIDDPRITADLFDGEKVDPKKYYVSLDVDAGKARSRIKQQSWIVCGGYAFQCAEYVPVIEANNSATGQVVIADAAVKAILKIIKSTGEEGINSSDIINRAKEFGVSRRLALKLLDDHAGEYWDIRQKRPGEKRVVRYVAKDHVFISGGPILRVEDANDEE